MNSAFFYPTPGNAKLKRELALHCACMCAPLLLACMCVCVGEKGAGKWVVLWVAKSCAQSAEIEFAAKRTRKKPKKKTETAPLHFMCVCVYHTYVCVSLFQDSGYMCVCV